MADRVRCVLRVDSVEPAYEGAPETAQRVRMSAMYDDMTPEAQRFAQYTPSAHFDHIVDNPALVGFYVPGREFWVDFTPKD